MSDASEVGQRPPAPLLRPGLRPSVVLAVLGLAAIGGGYYLRFHIIEDTAFAALCAGGHSDWTCTIRQATVAAIAPSAFGFAALISALLNLWRPSLALSALALIAAGLGLVLYNVSLSALALALLPLSLARPAAAA